MKISLKTYAGLDPAISQKDENCYTAFTTIGVDQQNNIYVLDTTFGHYTQHELIENIIFPKFIKYRHTAIGIETVAYQQAIMDEVVRLGRERNMPLPVKEVKTHKDKVTRAIAITPYFESGMIRLKQSQTELIDEMLQFPRGQKDDVLDSLMIAIDISKNARIDYDEIEAGGKSLF